MPKSDIRLILIQVTVIAIIFGVMFYFFFKEKEEIDINTAYTNGVIVRNYKGVKGSWHIEIKYSINDTCYLRSFFSTVWCQNGDCIGDTIRIEYSSKEPNAMRIVFDDGETQYPATELDGDYLVDCDSVFNSD